MPSVADPKFQSRESGTTISTEMEQVWPDPGKMAVTDEKDCKLETKVSTASTGAFSVVGFFQSKQFGDSRNSTRYFGQTTRNLFTWECVVLSLLLAIPAALSILICSASGFGIENYSWLATSNKDAMNWYYIFGATMAMIFIGIIFDIYQVWYYGLKEKPGTASRDGSKGKRKHCRFYLGFVYAPLSFYLFMGLGYFTGPWQPEYPFIVCLLHIPVVCVAVRQLWLRSDKCDATSFYSTLSAACFLVGIACIVWWAAWYAGSTQQDGMTIDRGWNQPMKAHLAEEIDDVWCIVAQSKNNATAGFNQCPGNEKLYLIWNDNLVAKDYFESGHRGEDRYFSCSSDNGLTENKQINVTTDTDPNFLCELGCYLSGNVALAADGVATADRYVVMKRDPTTGYSPVADEDQIFVSENVWAKYAMGTCPSGGQTLLILWAAPISTAMAMWVMAIFSYTVAHSVFSNEDGSLNINKHLKLVLQMIAFAVFAMYLSASIAATSYALADLVLSGAFSLMVVIVIWAIHSIGYSKLRRGYGDGLLVRMYRSDWCKAFLICACNIFIFIGLGMAFLCRQARKCWHSPVAGPYESRWLTTNASLTWQGLLDWNWTSVLKKANWLCFIYMCVTVVVSKLIMVLLSVLNEFLAGSCGSEGQPMGLVIVIYLSVGISLFLLPPVPGVPVYVLGGVVLVNKMWQKDEDTIWGGESGYWISMAIVSFIGLGLKLIACTIQQKVFGEQLGKLVSVRAMIGVNSDFTRCIGMILSAPGMTFSKVCVLCGGPDWPVSVTCGILKQNLWSILCGTLPVYFLIIPCVLSGAFMLRTGGAEETCPGALPPVEEDPHAASDEGLWQTMSEFTVLFTAILQNMSVMFAVGYVTSIVQENSRIKNVIADNTQLVQWYGSKKGFQWKRASDEEKIAKLAEVPPTPDATNPYMVLRRIRTDQLNHTNQDDRALVKDLSRDLQNIADALDNQFFEALKRKIQGSIVALEDPEVPIRSLRRDQFMKLYNDYKTLHPKMTSILPNDEVGIHSKPEKLRRNMQMLTRRSQVFADELRELVYDPLKTIKIDLQRCEDLQELDQAILFIANDMMSEVDDVRAISLQQENIELEDKLPEAIVDEEVAELERAGEHKKNTRLRCEANQSNFVFSLLFSSWLCQMLACTAVAWAGTALFRSFSLTNRVGDSFADGGLKGSVFNLFYIPYGLACLGLYIFGYLLWEIWHQVIKAQVRTRLAEELSDNLDMKAHRKSAIAIATMLAGEDAGSAPLVPGPGAANADVVV